MAGEREFRLSERLEMIASHIREGESAADIGTDHGYIPIRLLSGHVTDRVILTDINEGPLIKARNNFRRWLPGTEPELRQGPGLSVLAPGEADAVIIAGMGGILISRILEDDPGIVAGTRRFILQPRNHSFTLREYLRGMKDHVITDEEIALEAGRYCEIITLTRKDAVSEEEGELVRKAAELEKHLDLEQRIYDELPVMHALTGRYRDYLEYKSRTEIRVIEKILSHGRSAHADSRRLRAEQRMMAFRKIKAAQERMAENR